MIDIPLVQKLIEVEIHPDFTIGECYDTPLYIFINWKHKEYYPDDERCLLVGAGMIIYDKSKNEYRVMGSAESWHYELLESQLVEDPDRKRQRDIISNYWNGITTGEDERFWIINNIKKGIIRRNRINTEDIDHLCIITGARAYPWTEDVFDMGRLPGLEGGDHIIVIFDNKKARQELMQIWDEMGFKYEAISETELVLWKVKPAPGIGIANSGA